MTESQQRPRVLIALNESSRTKDLVAFLDRDYEVLWVREGQSAYETIDSEPLDALVCGLRESHIDGLRVLAVATKRNPEICAVVIADPEDHAHTRIIQMHQPVESSHAESSAENHSGEPTQAVQPQQLSNSAPDPPKLVAQ